MLLFVLILFCDDSLLVVLLFMINIIVSIPFYFIIRRILLK